MNNNNIVILIVLFCFIATVVGIVIFNVNSQKEDVFGNDISGENNVIVDDNTLDNSGENNEDVTPPEVEKNDSSSYVEKWKKEHYDEIVETIFEDENYKMVNIGNVEKVRNAYGIEEANKLAQNSGDIWDELFSFPKNTVNLKVENNKVLIECDAQFVRYYLNNTILSVILLENWENSTYHTTYNIDLENRKILTNEEFVNKIGEDYEKILTDVNQIAIDLICTEEKYNECKKLKEDYRAGLITADELKVDMGEYGMIIADDVIYSYETQMTYGCNEDQVELFLNADGELCFAALHYRSYATTVTPVEFIYNYTNPDNTNFSDLYID